jgi:hypothetical protein
MNRGVFSAKPQLSVTSVLQNLDLEYIEFLLEGSTPGDFKGIVISRIHIL